MTIYTAQAIVTTVLVLSILMILGDPDIVDGIVHRLMECGQ